MTPWFLSDELWIGCMAAARTAWTAGGREHAAGLWDEARRLSEGFPANDPRRAASLDAGANVAATAGDLRAGLLAALDAWERARDWVDAMNVVSGARSSLFHLRLESRHREAFAGFVRRRHQATRRAGRAGTAARLAALESDADALAAALEARRDAFGRRETGAVAMALRLGTSPDGPACDRFAEVPARRRDDEARLYAAALLAPVQFDHPAFGR